MTYVAIILTFLVGVIFGFVGGGLWFRKHLINDLNHLGYWVTGDGRHKIIMVKIEEKDKGLSGG